MNSSRKLAAAQALSPRRIPRQARARQTARALREAFVRLLTEQDYAAITIREIVDLAGTGLGSFYEYYASKEDLARVCLHLRSKKLLYAMRAAIANHAGAPLERIVNAVVVSQIEAHRLRPSEWGEHYVIERLLSGAEAYRKMYERFTGEWVAALEAAGDLPAGIPQREMARVCQAIMYGLFSNAHIGTGGHPNLAALHRLVLTAVCGSVKEMAKRST